MDLAQHDYRYSIVLNFISKHPAQRQPAYRYSCTVAGCRVPEPAARRTESEPEDARRLEALAGAHAGGMIALLTERRAVAQP